MKLVFRLHKLLDILNKDLPKCNAMLGGVWEIPCKLPKGHKDPHCGLTRHSTKVYWNK